MRATNADIYKNSSILSKYSLQLMVATRLLPTTGTDEWDYQRKTCQIPNDLDNRFVRQT